MAEQLNTVSYGEFDEGERHGQMMDYHRERETDSFKPTQTHDTQLKKIQPGSSSGSVLAGGWLVQVQDRPQHRMWAGAKMPLSKGLNHHTA